MTSLLASATASATQAAHAAAASILAAAQAKVGDPIPDAKVKEDNPEKTISLAGLTGRNIIVSWNGSLGWSCVSGLLMNFVCGVCVVNLLCGVQRAIYDVCDCDG